MPNLAERVAFAAVLLFVLALPIENMIVLPGVGTLSSGAGLLMVAVSWPAFLTRGGFSFRRPPVAVAIFAAYVLWAFMSLIWTVEASSTLPYAITFAQLFLFVLILWQVCLTRAQWQAVQVAYIIGCTIAAADGFRNMLTDQEAAFQRFAVSNTDPNDYALALVIAIPMAWQLFAANRGWSRIAYFLYIPVALVAVILSASRGGALAAAVALLVAPFGLRVLDRDAKRVLLMFAIAGMGAVPFLWTDIEPIVSSNIERISTLGDELTSGTLNERSSIWAVGMEAFSSRPILGVGGGAFRAAIETEAGMRQPAHNTFISVTVELGSVGLLLFVSIIVVAALPLLRRLSSDTVPSLLMLAALLVGVMSLTWEIRKPTWLVIGLLLTLRSIQVGRDHVSDVAGHAAKLDDSRLLPGPAEPGRSALEGLGTPASTLPEVAGRV